MKYLIIIFFSFSTLSYSQDLIVKRNGDSISSNISEIGINEIKYYKFNRPKGPIYIIDKNEVLNIVYNDGEIEHFSLNNKEKKELTIEEVKRTIIETINAYGSSYLTGKKYIAEFEANYLKLTEKSNLKNKRFSMSTYYCDFNADCNFHPISHRGSQFSILNVVVPLYYKTKDEKMKRLKDKGLSERKLVIQVEGFNNGRKLRDALIKYNSFLLEDN